MSNTRKIKTVGERRALEDLAVRNPMQYAMTVGLGRAEGSCFVCGDLPAELYRWQVSGGEGMLCEDCAGIQVAMYGAGDVLERV